MKCFTAAAMLLAASLISFSQDHAKQIYDTERAFEKMVAEKGINAGFIEFLSPLGVMFFPDPLNGREVWAKRAPSPAALTWNPIVIDVSSNGALGYSIGNSIFRPNGKDDTNELHGHYISVWTRQLNGEYRAALDTGIHHPKPAVVPIDWKPGPPATPDANVKKTFAGDSSIGFYRMAEDRGFGRAYRAYAADNIYLMREGKFPIIGRDAAADYIEDQKLAVRFFRRRSFIEAGDLAYVYSTYFLIDKNGTEKERGNFIQVWRLRNGRWQIVADVFKSVPPAGS